MNSYNENLHSSVVSALNEQELKLQKTKATLDASMFSLYYAEGARITAAENLHKANEQFSFQQLVKEQAVIDSDLSTNVLASANLGNELVAKSVTNTSVAAANVQIASNAILKLASDTGSIFSMVNAADYGTEIYDQSKEAYELMNETAYLAEKTSQYSMEASTLIAEVPSNTLSKKAQTTDTSIKSLLEAVTTNFNTASANVATESASLADTNSKEKAKEGTLENINTVYNSEMQAYSLYNKELNLNLLVKVPDVIGERSNYKVSFNSYKSPFNKGRKRGYPVKKYYIFLVKNDRKEIFSISDAEALILMEPDSKRYLELPSVADDKHEIDIYQSQLKDVDGKSMGLGENYVVFVFAVLDNEYKKLLSTFDDYLSAPSAMFRLTKQLAAPDSNTIKVIDNKMLFHIDENEDDEVEYRCMFLPNNKKLVKGLLTVEGLKTIESETKKLERIADKYDPIIAKLESKINNLTSEKGGVEDLLSVNIEEQSSDDLEAKELKKLKDERKKLKVEYKNTSSELSKLEKELTIVERKKQQAINSIETPEHIQPGFFFNYTIASGLNIETYSVAKKVDKEGEWEVEITTSTTDNFGNRLHEEDKYIPVVLAMPDEGEGINKQIVGALSDFQNTKDFTYKKKSSNVLTNKK
ncbi:hypothetical protein [Tenacibaculum larymnensis]|uniref:Uncharacterized protein n=1 Tax=Tenacibaculum larymnensis TaxID=2878201 RepID=A0A9X4EMT7_9FLAO|nr:hypothetical protein [Tenacibaculum larymnensis]MDE1206974.1 hypothetical protein [Tenacibaculum larymnensis]